MGIGKIGATIGKEIIAWTKTGKSLFATKPVKINITGLHFASEASGDTIQISKNTSIIPKLKKELYNISKIEVIPNPNKRLLTELEQDSMRTTTGREMIMWLFKPDSSFTLQNYCHPDEYIKSISKILGNHKHLNQTEYVSLLEDLTKELELLAKNTAKELPLSSGMEEIGNTLYRYQAVQNIRDKQTILKKIIQEMKIEKINDSETFSNYFERLYTKIKQIPKENKKIKYSEIDMPTEKILLSNKEKEEFKRLCLEKNEYFNNKLTSDMTFEEIADKWCELRVSDYVETAESIGTTRMQSAALQTLPRYKGAIGVDGQVRPLVRWLHVYPNKKPRKPTYNEYWTAEQNAKFIESYPRRLENWKTFDTDNWVDENFKVGETYSYPKMQSTSTSLTWSEGVFRDDNPGMNIKFIIHPRSKTSKAYYMGTKSIGDGEAVYLPDEKFKILDKRVERAEDSVGTIFYRHIIEMQEI